MKKALLLFLLVLPLFQCAFQENAAQPVKPVAALLESQFDQFIFGKSNGHEFRSKAVLSFAFLLPGPIWLNLHSSIQQKVQSMNRII